MSTRRLDCIRQRYRLICCMSAAVEEIKPAAGTLPFVNGKAAKGAPEAPKQSQPEKPAVPQQATPQKAPVSAPAPAVSTPQPSSTAEKQKVCLTCTTSCRTLPGAQSPTCTGNASMSDQEPCKWPLLQCAICLLATDLQAHW